MLTELEQNNERLTMAISNPPEADRLLVLASPENSCGPDNYRDQLGIYLP